MCDALLPKKLVDTEPHLVRTLKSNNETLQNINLHFLDIYERFEIHMAHEAVKTDLKGTRSFIVDQMSASPQLPGVTYYGIEATHSGMCKFESKNAPGYLNVSMTIKSWVQDCALRIHARWEEERKLRTAAKEALAKELLGFYGNVCGIHFVDWILLICVQLPKTSQASSTHTPGMSHSSGNDPQENRPPQRVPYRIDAPRSSPSSVFKSAKIEEKDTELAES